ncbi:molybdate ABC transporter permease subunit [Leucobacter coleopterorum]|uniref:Molybdenum transport system permease n=1 Tax=Leucobacter coleopterorum TaxID=2714933 RepID=A0ABX6K199_9MICO|nr:ABC transporter permease [Leucobacter coleopterorum]QIM18869.1 molybdate ABC transporter permease subunit [Leucobacter coleopterorum]
MRRSDTPTSLPVAIWAPAGLAAAVLLLPLAALCIRVDWVQVPATLASPAALSALGLSLLTASIATVLCVLLGLPLALVIARAPGPLATALRALTTLPLVLPPLVGGLALLSLLGRGGVLGDWLAELGIRIPFTTAAVVIAQTFVALPFLVISVEGALRSLDSGYEHVAESLGARPWTVLRRVTLPLLAPSLGAGAILCFTRALGEFGATALFAGNSPGTTRTMPLAIYTAFNGAGVTQDTALTLSLLLVLVAIVALMFTRVRPAGLAS